MQKNVQQYEREQLKKQLKFLETLIDMDADERAVALQLQLDELQEKINEFEQHEHRNYGNGYDLTLFCEPILCETNRIRLRKPTLADKEPHFNLRKQYALLPFVYQRENYIEEDWAEYIGDTSLFYTIENAASAAYIGYCGVKDVRKEIWEIAVEIVPTFQKQGYGYEAVTVYLREVAKLSGCTTFSSRVDADNIGSQKLMEKVGFTPYGLADFIFYDEEQKEQIEQENLPHIQERHIAIAEKFHTKPQKLFTHLLEYRITIE